MDQACNHLVGKKGLNWLKSLKLEGNNDQFQLNNHINNIEFLNNEIMQIDKKVSSQAVKNKDVKILMSMTGIDYFSAMLITSEIGDITRFSDPSKLVSWAGLCPTIHQWINAFILGLKSLRLLTTCSICHKGLNSNYIRVGAKESFKKVGLYCITCDIYYSPNLEKQYTNLLKSHKSMGNRNNINMDIKPSNNPNKPTETIENLYGPGRIRTNDPRHVKAVS